MTARVEDRARRAVEQLGAFRALDAQTRDAVLSAALGRPVRDVTIYDGLFTRSCLGRATLWTTAGEAALLNPALLALLISRHRAAGTKVDLGLLASGGRALLKEMEASVAARWTSKTVRIGTYEIKVPMLDTSSDAMMSWRLRAALAHEGRHAEAARPVEATGSIIG